MQESSKQVVLKLLEALPSRPRTILDAPSGNGWLGERLPFEATVDGIDLYAQPDGAGRYRTIHACDLDDGLPAALPVYDCITCCEGIEHVGNPLLLLKSMRRHLVAGGALFVTTPNIWHPASKGKFYRTGFFPDFPCYVDRIAPGSHMHITPWSFPQLALYLRLAGFGKIRLHAEPLSRPKRWLDRPFALLQKLYCARKSRAARNEEDRLFWEQAASEGSRLGRHLIVSAVAA